MAIDRAARWQENTFVMQLLSLNSIRSISGNLASQPVAHTQKEEQMKATAVAILASACVISLGCSSVPTKTTANQKKLTPVSAVSANAAKSKGKDAEGAVQKELDNLLLECRPVLTNFEDDSRAGARRGFYLSIAGLIAGAVIAPALTAANASANAAWIAAFSGFSGATNTASEVLKTSGLSGSHAAQDRNAIITRIRDQLSNVFSGAKSDQEKMTAISLAKAECALYMITIPSYTPLPGGEGSGGGAGGGSGGTGESGGGTADG